MDPPFKTKRAAEATDALKEMPEHAKDEGMEAPQEINGDLEADFRAKHVKDLLPSKEMIWRPKTGTRREHLKNIAQRDSAIGRWRRALPMRFKHASMGAAHPFPMDLKAAQSSTWAVVLAAMFISQVNSSEKQVVLSVST